MTLAYRIYQCHRVFFYRATTDRRYARSHSACTSAADVIIAIACRGIPGPFYLLWNITVMMVAAGLVCALDRLHGSRTMVAVDV